MNDLLSSAQPSPTNPAIIYVPEGQDRYGEQRSLGISEISFKFIPPDSRGTLILENTFHDPGGPARHLHYDQDEWFYIVEGLFVFEVGETKMVLRPGDSILGPRRVPHVWAFVGGGRGRILITFMPAGKMEGFFREVTKAGAMPPQEPGLWKAHGMELLGPPLNGMDINQPQLYR